MTDVFLSYAREDQRVAERLARALEAQELDVWWDRHIAAGSSFDDAIERELESAASVIVLWSGVSIQSEWVRSEASAAAERGVLIPVSIEAVRPPLEFRRKQTVELADWQGEAEHLGFQGLLDAVRHHVGTSEGASPASTGPSALRAKQAPKRRGPVLALLALLAAIALGALLYGLRGVPQHTPPTPKSPPAVVKPPPSPPRHYAWKLNLSNIDQEVYVEVNSNQVLKKVGGEVAFDLQPHLTGGDDRVYLRLGNGDCFGSSLHAQFLRDGKPIGAPARYQVAVSHCGWQLDWEWTINKTSGAMKRTK